MRTAVLSDLHVSAVDERDLARRPEALDRLLRALEPADRVVLLGDALELRERPLATQLEIARPVFERLAEVTAGKRLTLVPGNHDHALAEPWLSSGRLVGRALGAENEWPVEADERHGAAGMMASWLPGTEVTLAYPGLRLRPDTYATHGHYLDLPLTVPRLESIAASAMARLAGRGEDCGSAHDFEAAMAPLYGFYAGLSEGASRAALERGGRLSRTVWRRATSNGTLGRVLIGRITIPVAVVALNRLGLGRFSSELSAEELRLAGLVAMSRVADTLAPGAEHVLFGHTHRAGPLDGDDPDEWRTVSGTRLWNTGNWYVEPVFVSSRLRESPYWPGTVVWLDETGPPRIENALPDYTLAAPH